MSTTTTTLRFDERDAFQQLCGPHDKNLKLVEQLLEVVINPRGNIVALSGEAADVAVAAETLDQFYELARSGFKVFSADIPRGVRIVATGHGTRLADVFLDTVFVAGGKKKIGPKNLSQKHYIDAIREHDLVFGIGPAGTGKTYLAMAMAVAALANHEVQRIILTRPAVEAGEKLGFLPGDMAEKVNPYLRPLYDALYEMLDVPRVHKYLSEQVIEVAPLAFMRGRTLNDAFVILDEAQNATREQMRMFLTRLGFGAKAVVTGDVTQTDLPDRDRSGLAHAARLLDGVQGISICEFHPEDVVRHPLVMRIVRAYDQDDAQRPARVQDGAASGRGEARPTLEAGSEASAEDVEEPSVAVGEAAAGALDGAQG